MSILGGHICRLTRSQRAARCAPCLIKADSPKSCSLGPSNEYIKYNCGHAQCPQYVPHPILTYCHWNTSAHVVRIASAAWHRGCYTTLHTTSGPTKPIGETGLRTTPLCHWFPLPPGPWFIVVLHPNHDLGGGSPAQKRKRESIAWHFKHGATVYHDVPCGTVIIVCKRPSAVYRKKWNPQV